MIISLLDNDGNVKGNPIILNKDKLRFDDHIVYTSASKNIYNGKGYRCMIL